MNSGCMAAVQEEGQQLIDGAAGGADGEQPNPDPEAGTLESIPTAAEQIAAQQTDPTAR